MRDDTARDSKERPGRGGRHVVALFLHGGPSKNRRTSFHFLFFFIGMPPNTNRRSGLPRVR